MKILGFETEFKKANKELKIAVGMTSFGTKFGIRFNKATLQGGDNSTWLPALADSRKKGEESIFRSFSDPQVPSNHIRGGFLSHGGVRRRTCKLGQTKHSRRSFVV